jgi:hypothetical protein
MEGSIPRPSTLAVPRETCQGPGSLRGLRQLCRFLRSPTIRMRTRRDDCRYTPRIDIVRGALMLHAKRSVTRAGHRRLLTPNCRRLGQSPVEGSDLNYDLAGSG